MQPAGRLIAFGVAVVLVALTSWLCTAAPIVPERRRVTNEIRSLAGIAEVEVEVDSASSVLAEMKYPVDRMKKRTADLLAEHGIMAVTDSAAPILNLVLLTETSQDHPEMVSFTYHLSLEQDVVLERLNEKILVPTYALVHGSLTTREKLTQTIDELLPVVIRHFASRVQVASHAQ